MGHTYSNLKEILYVSGADLDPPHLKVQQNHNPHKSPQLDYRTYGPKKWWKEDSSEQQLALHLQKLQKKENILKQFKQHKEFDRIQYKRMNDQATIFQLWTQEVVKLLIVAALLGSRMLAVQHGADYFTVGLWRRLFYPMAAILIPTSIVKIFTAEEYHIINHDYFRLTPNQVAEYAQLDQKMNLYKDVEDMKYNFKYHSLRQFYKTRRYVHEASRDSKWNWYKEIWQYEMGLKTEPLEQYAKLRQGKRKANWEILTPQEKLQIERELQNRKDDCSPN